MKSGEILSPWLLVRAQTSREHVVRDALQHNGAEVYLPLTECLRVRSRRSEVVQQPFFPNYIFVRPGAMELRRIKTTVCVSSIIMAGSAPVQVAAHIVDAIKARADERGLIQLPDTTPKKPVYRRGDQIRVIQGPLAGLNAVFQANSGAMRAKLLLQMATAWQKVTIPLDQIAHATSA